MILNLDAKCSLRARLAPRAGLEPAAYCLGGKPESGQTTLGCCRCWLREFGSRPVQAAARRLIGRRQIAATFEEHGETRQPSTRYRDLVDFAAIVNGGSVTTEAQSCALRPEFDRRGLTVPGRSDVPDPALWNAGRHPRPAVPCSALRARLTAR